MPEPIDDGAAIAALRAAGTSGRRDLMDALDRRAISIQHTDPRQALVDLREARALAADLGVDQTKWREFTRRAANACERIGDLVGARQLYAESRPPADASVDEKYAWSNGRALLAERLGEWMLATQYYDAVVDLFGQLTEIGVNRLFGLSNAAAWMAGSGQPDKAAVVFAQFKRALAQQPDSGVTYEVPMVEAQMALAAGDLQKAERAWAQVADIVGKTAPGALPIVAEERAAVLIDMQRSDDAVALLRQYVEADESKADAGYEQEILPAAIALGGILTDGSVRDDDAATLAEARTILRRALASEASRGMPEAEWRILSALAETAARLDNPSAAVTFGKAAVAILAQLDALQSNPVFALRDLNRRLLPYRRLRARLVDGGRFPEAARIDDMMKQEAAFDFGRRDGLLDGRAKAVPLRPAEERELAVYRDICSESRLANARMHGLAEVPEGEVPFVKPEAGRAAIVAWADRLLNGQWDARQSVGQARVRDADPAPLADGTLEVRFVRSAEHWHVIARSQQGERDFRVAVGADAVAQDIFALRRAIIRGHDDWMKPARSLFDVLLRPLNDWIAGGGDLLIRADMPLGYLPFAALHDGERFLIERLPLAIGTGLTPPRRAAGRPQDWRVVLFGNDDRGAREIPHVESEMRSILESQPAARRVVPLNAATLSEALAEGPEIVHVASHFHLEPARPDLSYLSLDGGETLTLERFRSAEFDLSNVELLVLSACDTAVEDMGIHGLESFAGLAQVKGARQVLGSLWPVQDVSAARLMGLFHAGLRADADASRRWAENLRAAQLGLLRESKPPIAGATRAGGLSMPKPAVWRHPYHWAGYVLYR